MNDDTFGISRRTYNQLFMKEKHVTYYTVIKMYNAISNPHTMQIRKIYLRQVYVIYENRINMPIRLESAFPPQLMNVPILNRTFL